jgi:hypothetical protein
VIWANECFELWYLLHFCFRNTAINRHQLPNELSRADRLGKRYNKADQSIYAILESKIDVALHHAQQLEDHYGSDLKSVRDNPSTNIHHLVRQLLKLKAGLI